MVRIFTIAAAFAAIQCTFASLQEAHPEAINNKVSGVQFVEYYNPDCKNCEDFEPILLKLVKARPHATFNKINCGTHTRYCKDQGIVRTPTLQSNLNGGEWNEYTGDFTFEDVDKYVEKHLPKRNERGESVELISSKQLKSIVESKEPWFVKFYAPWCGHCKHLAPIWKDVAKALRNKVNVAEVNCENHKLLCSEYKVSGLPTLTYFVHGATLKYNGKRDFDSLYDYAITAADSPVRAIEKDAEFEDLFKKQDVNVVYVRRSAEEHDDLSFLEKVAPGFMESIPFYSTSDKKSALRFNLEETDLPAAVIVKDGTFHQFKSPDIKNLAAWVLKESKPLVTRVTPHNSNSIIKGDRVVVLGITQSDDEGSIEKLRDLAKLYKEKHQGKDLTFAVLDGKTWGGFIARAYNIQSKNLPALLVLDPKNELYYDKHADNKKFSLDVPEAILTSIKALDKLTGITTAPSKTMTILERFFAFFGDYWMIVTPLMVGTFALVFYLMTQGDPSPLSREEMKKVAEKVIQEKKAQEKARENKKD